MPNCRQFFLHDIEVYFIYFLYTRGRATDGRLSRHLEGALYKYSITLYLVFCIACDALHLFLWRLLASWDPK